MPEVENAAQNPLEPFDVILADGTPTGRIKPRGQVHRDGDWHRALHVWVAGRLPDGAPFLTFQRRSQRKDTWPGRYDATVGGHYRHGETLAETLREVEEEIGVASAGLTLRSLGVRVCANEAEPGIVDRELQEVFLLVDDRPLEAYRPDANELASLARFSLMDLLPLLSGEASTACGVSLAANDLAVESVNVTLDDFIPTIDRYFLRVAIAVGHVLRGDRYVAV